MKRSFASLRLSLAASRIIYLSFQDLKSVVFDRRANQAVRMDGKQEAYSLWETTQHSDGRRKNPAKSAFKSEGTWKMEKWLLAGKMPARLMKSQQKGYERSAC